MHQSGQLKSSVFRFHHDIQDDHIGALRLHFLDAHIAADGLDHLVADTFQAHPNSHQDIGIIVNYKYFSHGFFLS